MKLIIQQDEDLFVGSIETNEGINVATTQGASWVDLSCMLVDASLLLLEVLRDDHPEHQRLLDAIRLINDLNQPNIEPIEKD